MTARRPRTAGQQAAAARQAEILDKGNGLPEAVTVWLGPNVDLREAPARRVVAVSVVAALVDEITDHTDDVYDPQAAAVRFAALADVMAEASRFAATQAAMYRADGRGDTIRVLSREEAAAMVARARAALTAAPSTPER